MGIFSFVKSQFIEAIEWTDRSAQTIVYRFPVQNHQIKMGARLTVRESQAAVFVNEGKIADVFSPGRYTLSTENLPVLTAQKSWKYGFNSPFKAEVYFINTKQFTDQKWGTTNPVMMRDPDFGLIRLRAFGTFTFKVSDAELFLKEIFVTNQIYDTAYIVGQLKSFLVSGLSDALGETEIAAPELASRYDELSEMTENKLQNRFARMGLELSAFIIENISLPEEVEKAIDERAKMSELEEPDEEMVLQTAAAIEDAAPSAEEDIEKDGEQDGVPEPTGSCSSCGHELQEGMKFCPECGTAVQTAISCTGCGHPLKPGMKFCPDCGTKV